MTMTSGSARGSARASTTRSRSTPRRRPVRPRRCSITSSRRSPRRSSPSAPRSRHGRPTLVPIAASVSRALRPPAAIALPITPRSSAAPTAAVMAEITLVEAVTLALAHELDADARVVVLGEDIGVNGGVFRATAGLLERFGPERVIDTPLAETLIAGMSVGMAAQGLRPVAEIQFMGFIYSALDQMLSHASRLRTRTQGRLMCPMVLRAPFGGGIHAPEHHSESTETLLAHVPGLRVVAPSSPARAYGLLLAAIRDPDPVVFLEP